MILPISGVVEALAISDVELHSRLNQRLEAQIFLQAVSQEELKSLNISITDVTGKTGNYKNVALKYEIIENENGHYIKITSREVIREPFLNFLLELHWSKGRLIREYSLLIDPQ